MNARALKRTIIASLRDQGFVIDRGRSSPPAVDDKHRVRELHAAAVLHRVQQARGSLQRFEAELLGRFAEGGEVVPYAIRPRLVEVLRGSPEERLFRYATLHWSIPVSSGYGRRLRYLILDETNGKLIGLIGLGDPVYALGPRDTWIGWQEPARRQRLHAVMDAFVLGAVPPYSRLLCGKLVAMLAVSNEVREAVRRKYARSESRISGRPLPGHLVLITTTSALGRSSLYNRLKFNACPLYLPVGYTRGSGDFHFSNGIYEAIKEFAYRRELFTSKRPEWGDGFRNKREVIKKSLIALGISSEWIYHGVRREIFVAPTATNTAAYLRGEHKRPRWIDRPAATIFDYFRDRWLLPRAEREPGYQDFRVDTLRLWGTDRPDAGNCRSARLMA